MKIQLKKDKIVVVIKGNNFILTKEKIIELAEMKIETDFGYDITDRVEFAGLNEGISINKNSDYKIYFRVKDPEDNQYKKGIVHFSFKMAESVQEKPIDKSEDENFYIDQTKVKNHVQEKPEISNETKVDNTEIVISFKPSDFIVSNDNSTFNASKTKTFVNSERQHFETALPKVSVEFNENIDVNSYSFKIYPIISDGKVVEKNLSVLGDIIASDYGFTWRPKDTKKFLFNYKEDGVMGIRYIIEAKNSDVNNFASVLSDLPEDHDSDVINKIREDIENSRDNNTTKTFFEEKAHNEPTKNIEEIKKELNKTSDINVNNVAINDDSNKKSIHNFEPTDSLVQKVPVIYTEQLNTVKTADELSGINSSKEKEKKDIQKKKSLSPKNNVWKKRGIWIGISVLLILSISGIMINRSHSLNAVAPQVQKINNEQSSALKAISKTNVSSADITSATDKTADARQRIIKLESSSKSVWVKLKRNQLVKQQNQLSKQLQKIINQSNANQK